MSQNESYQGLARTWRPQNFEDLVGQDAVTQSLQSALRQGRLAHGHMLAGPRGVGKTSSARILARSLNCATGPSEHPCGKCRHCIDIAAGNDLDVIEIDAASNTKVEQMRDILERVIQAPFAARFKVYIIDEVHMLSIAAFNALLKTLEEPPPNVVFIFATTEIDKVPETIRSRCVMHNFRRLSAEDIIKRLQEVGEGEKVDVSPDDAQEIYGLIARSVEGGMRDALVLFDQLLALTDSKPDVESTLKLLGLADRNALKQTIDWLVNGNAKELLDLINDLVDRGRNLERFAKGLTAYLRDLMLLQAGGSDELTSLTGEGLEEARRQAMEMAPAQLFNLLNNMFELEQRMRQSTQVRFLIEFTFLRLASIKPVVPIDDIMRRINALPEQALGDPQQTPAKPAPEPARQAAQSEPPEAVVTPSEAAPAAKPLRSRSTEASAATFFNDSAPAEAPAPVPAETTANEPLTETVESEPVCEAITEELTREEIVERIVPLLPDTSQFLGRYLREVFSFTLRDGYMEIAWPVNRILARRLMDKPENQSALEASLTRMYGRPLRVTYAEAPADAQPQAQPRTAPPSPEQQAPVMMDSSPQSEPPPLAGLTAPAKSVGDAEPTDTRSALEKAKAFLSVQDETHRRVKLVTDMLKGEMIDECGEPLPIG